MDFKKFKHNDPDGFHDREISLHDCVANRILCEDGLLRFLFPDGFWVTPHHRENDLNKTVRTGPAAVTFTVKDPDDITVRVFTNNTFCWSTKSRAELWHIDQLISAVNSGKYTIEFITQYRSFYEQLWHCVIHSDKKPYFKECHLYLPETEATYFWDTLLPDRQW